MDTEIRLLERRVAIDPSQIPRLLVAQKRAGQMLFKNSKGLEILNQCAGSHSAKFEIKNSTRIEFGLDFPAPLNNNPETHRTWVFIDIAFSKKEEEKDTINLYLQVGKNSILVEKVYLSDADSIQMMADLKKLNSGLKSGSASMIGSVLVRGLGVLMALFIIKSA